jgi:hypothetical protein
MSARKWVAQPDLFSYPKSRWNNPATSRAAAESISLEKITDTQAEDHHDLRRWPE